MDNEISWEKIKSDFITLYSYIFTEIGQIRRQGTTWNRFYFLKDHLGSVKVIVNASGARVAHNDYYPFGMLMPGRMQEASSVDGRYKFTGKERDTETNYDYFGARYYDARIGRWLQVDPLGEKYPKLSPYVYCENKPLILKDINGKQGVYFGLGYAGGIGGYQPKGLREPNLLAAKIIIYSGAEKDRSQIIGITSTISGGGIIGGSLGAGLVFGTWFSEFDEMVDETTSLGINLKSVFFEIILNDKLDIVGFEFGLGGKGIGLGIYTTENKSTNLFVKKMKANYKRNNFNIDEIGKVSADATNVNYIPTLRPLSFQFKKQGKIEDRIKEIENQYKRNTYFDED